MIDGTESLSIENENIDQNVELESKVRKKAFFQNQNPSNDHRRLMNDNLDEK